MRGVPSRLSARVLRATACAALLALAAACRATGPRAEEGPELVFARLLAADSAGDAEAAAACYTDEAVLVPPDRAPVAGREAIQAHYASLFEHTTRELSSKTEIGRVAGTLAWHVGRTFGAAVDRETQERTLFEDRYTAILELCPDGRWRVAALTWAPAK